MIVGSIDRPAQVMLTPPVRAANSRSNKARVSQSTTTDDSTFAPLLDEGRLRYEAWVTTELRQAASVILLRRGGSSGARGGFQVFLLRRRRGASFMASAFVFPGGGVEQSDSSPRVTAARELFEEAGVLLVRATNSTARNPSNAEIASWRRDAAAGQSIETILAAHHLAWDESAMTPWSHWITPSIEPKRFSARFFVAILPDGQEPSFDDQETVDQAWVTASEAIVRAGDLSLPPPQVRTCWELARLPSIDDVIAAARARGENPPAILPRMAPGPGGLRLLLPWDPEYLTAGSGDCQSMNPRPAWAHGPSRFELEDRTWRHLLAPISTPLA